MACASWRRDILPEGTSLGGAIGAFEPEAVQVPLRPLAGGKLGRNTTMLSALLLCTPLLVQEPAPTPLFETTLSPASELWCELRHQASREGEPEGPLADAVRCARAIELMLGSPIAWGLVDAATFDAELGAFLAIKAVVPSMRKCGRGKIINISSGTVLAGAPQFLHYVTSKGAIMAMSRSLSRELGGDNICVNTIAPGLTESEGLADHPDYDEARAGSVSQRAFKRDMVPDDLTGTVLYLASPDSDFLTGQMINVDGGRSHY